ncbi:MAG: hypothetical protein HKM93_11515, partial [Desulfobacteraceae bacterium]|nr:hypothetical protein [Desulfobacteraceae bacterium]
MPISKSAAKLHGDSIVIDMSVQYLTGRTDRSDVSGLTAVGLTIPIPGEDAYQTLYRARDFLDVIASEPLFCIADSPDAIRRAHAEGKMAHIFLSQDSLFIGTDAKNLLIWKQMGLRVCQLTYNEKNPVGDGCLELNDGGLSKFGQVLIREMEGVGITIDLTHAGERTYMEACARARKPLITTHSNPKAVSDNPRNITDDQIKAVADTGGVICVTTWAPLIWNGKPGMPGLDDYIRSLEHTINLVGLDHVATSTDSMGT